MSRCPRLSLAIRGINDTSPDDPATVRTTYLPTFSVASASGDPATDFLSDIKRVRGELLVFVPKAYRPFLERLAKEAVVPDPDDNCVLPASPEEAGRCHSGQLLMMSYRDCMTWERLSRFVRDAYAAHTAVHQTPKAASKVFRSLRWEYPELVMALDMDRRSAALLAATDRVSEMPRD